MSVTGAYLALFKRGAPIAAKAALVAAASFAASCHPSQTQVTTRKQENTSAGFVERNLNSDRNRNCVITPNRDPITDAEQPYFLSRIEAGVVVAPIDVKCLNDVYGQDRILSEYRLGDGLATLASLDLRFRSLPDVCSHFQEIDSELESVSHIKANIPFGPQARIPEAFYLRGALRFDCGLPGWEEYYSKSPSAGFEPVARHSPAVD